MEYSVGNKLYDIKETKSATMNIVRKKIFSL